MERADELLRKMLGEWVTEWIPLRLVWLLEHLRCLKLSATSITVTLSTTFGLASSSFESEKHHSVSELMTRQESDLGPIKMM